MGTFIHASLLGVGTSYIIKDQGVIMIDSGEPKKGRVFLDDLEAVGITPSEIQLIILTHGHWDHIGSAAEIKELTGAKVVLHQNEKHWLEEGLKPMPPGITIWGKISALLMGWSLVPFIHIKPTNVDIVLNDADFSLQEYGIPGKIVSLSAREGFILCLQCVSGGLVPGGPRFIVITYEINLMGSSVSNPAMPVIDHIIENIQSACKEPVPVQAAGQAPVSSCTVCQEIMVEAAYIAADTRRKTVPGARGIVGMT